MKEVGTDMVNHRYETMQRPREDSNIALVGSKLTPAFTALKEDTGVVDESTTTITPTANVDLDTERRNSLHSIESERSSVDVSISKLPQQTEVVSEEEISARTVDNSSSHAQDMNI